MSLGTKFHESKILPSAAELNVFTLLENNTMLPQEIATTKEKARGIRRKAGYDVDTLALVESPLVVFALS